ncbi:MAG: HAD family hydrolase [Isosphaeraceae bacterium]
MRRAVFLDRDGVINRAFVRGGKPYPPRRPEELEILPGVPEAAASLRRAGFLVIGATNQPDLSAGLVSAEALDLMHERIRAEVGLDDVKVCPHDDSRGCECRKPRPGMLLDAARGWSIDLAASWMVGDCWRDVSAGRAAGCRTVLVGGGYGEAFPDDPDARVDSLAEAAALILSAGGPVTRRTSV